MQELQLDNDEIHNMKTFILQTELSVWSSHREAEEEEEEDNMKKVYILTS